MKLIAISYKLKAKQGFTLIETVLATGILLIVIAALAFFTLSILDVRTKLTSAQEVQANMRMAFDVMSQKMRSATGVNVASSTLGTDPGVLVLTMSDPTKNPTTFRLTADNGQLQIQEGISGPVSITSNEVLISNLTFNLASGVGEQENIRIEMTANYAFQDSTYASYTENFQTSVTTRN